MTRGSILAVVTEGSLTCPPWRSHLEVDLQSETRPRLAVAQMHRVRGYIFDEARVYEHSSVVWSVTSAAVHLQRYSCVSVYPCICDISVYLHVKVECWKRAAHAGALRVRPLPATGPTAAFGTDVDGRWCQSADDRVERSGRRRITGPGWVMYRLPRRGVRGTAGTAPAGHANTTELHTPAERLTNGSLGRWVV